ncbi:MAG: ABC transporter substrate-binding protein, partial [Chloroflexi bacterium]|nr:ABC transporter substrate-binding protein [Chloroflexota bacterium]
VAFSFNDANSVTNPESIHGQAGDFAPLIASMEPLDDYTIRLNYRNYDSRGVLHRFSAFWQTAGIMSKNAFDTLGVEGMQNDYSGVGPFMADEWTDDTHILMSAFMDYWGMEEGLGPFVQTARWLEVPAGSSRLAMLETGEAQIAAVALKDVPALKQKGFTESRGALLNEMLNVAMTGNYWEQFSALTGAPLERERDTSKPWVGNPFENGDTFDGNTPSMVSSRHVRNAFAWAVPRQEMLDNLLLGLGFTSHQPYLSKNNPNYKAEWGWSDTVDAAKAKAELDQSNFAGGFEMDLWVGTGELEGQMGETVGASWQQNLNVKVNLIKTVYSTYRPGLVSRTTSTPFMSCGDENKSNFPYDWAHGFVMSSISSGGYGVGMEVP